MMFSVKLSHYSAHYWVQIRRKGFWMDFAMWHRSPTCIKVNMALRQSSKIFIFAMYHGFLGKIKVSCPINGDCFPYHQKWRILNDSFNAGLIKLLSRTPSDQPTDFRKALERQFVKKHCLKIFNNVEYCCNVINTFKFKSSERISIFILSQYSTPN